MAGKIVESFKVLTTLAASRIVCADTANSNTVTYPASASMRYLGVTTDTVKDTNGSIPVQIAGRAKLYFNETMPTGALVATDSSGRGVPHVDVTAGSYVIGQLVGPAIAATGTIADIILNPFFKSIP